MASSGNIVGIGIDLVEIARIRQVYERHGSRFLDRVYTPTEQQHVKQMQDPAPFLAGRWAAKEAIFKTFGDQAISQVGWQQIEIERQGSGAPKVRLRGPAKTSAEAKGIHEILISISHTREHAVAQAVAVTLP